MAVLAIAGLHGFGMYSVAICPKRMYDFPYMTFPVFIGKEPHISLLLVPGSLSGIILVPGGVALGVALVKPEDSVLFANPCKPADYFNFNRFLPAIPPVQAVCLRERRVGLFGDPLPEALSCHIREGGGDGVPCLIARLIQGRESFRKPLLVHTVPEQFVPVPVADDERDIIP